MFITTRMTLNLINNKIYRNKNNIKIIFNIRRKFVMDKEILIFVENFK